MLNYEAEFARLKSEHEYRIAKINRNEKLMYWLIGLAVTLPPFLLFLWRMK
jgi:hypothetical protein